jgi:hypothetical protein
MTELFGETFDQSTACEVPRLRDLWLPDSRPTRFTVIRLLFELRRDVDDGVLSDLKIRSPIPVPLPDQLDGVSARRQLQNRRRLATPSGVDGQFVSQAHFFGLRGDSQGGSLVAHDAGFQGGGKSFIVS